MPASRAIQERLDQLHDQWTTFARRDCRLLIWQAADDERTLIEAFVDKECDADAAETPDLFVQLTCPFTDEATHGTALLEELATQHAEAAHDADEAHLSPWQRPHAREGELDVCALARALLSLHRHHLDAGTDGKLAVWLDPSDVEDAGAYLRWLRRLVRALPSEVRLVAVESTSQATYAALAESERAQVAVVPCALDMPGALEALARGAGSAGPGDRLRLLLVQLGNAAASDLPRTRTLATDATRLAVAEGWLALAVVPQLMLATACVTHGDPNEALHHLAEAERLAALQEAREREVDAAEPAAPCGARLRLQAKLGRAGVLLAQRAYLPASQAYLDAASLARQIDDPRSELDGYRLASFCLAADGAPATAWEVGMRGLRVGLALDEDTRRTSTLLDLAEQLLRMAQEHRALRHYGPPLDAELARVLGAAWRAGATER